MKKRLYVSGHSENTEKLCKSYKWNTLTLLRFALSKNIISFHSYQFPVHMKLFVKSKSSTNPYRTDFKIVHRSP